METIRFNSVLNPNSGKQVKLGGPSFLKLLNSYVYDYIDNKIIVGPCIPQRVKNPETGRRIKLYGFKFFQLARQ